MLERHGVAYPGLPPFTLVCWRPGSLPTDGRSLISQDVRAALPQASSLILGSGGYSRVFRRPIGRTGRWSGPGTRVLSSTKASRDLPDFCMASTTREVARKLHCPNSPDSGPGRGLGSSRSAMSAAAAYLSSPFSALGRGIRAEGALARMPTPPWVKAEGSGRLLVVSRHPSSASCNFLLAIVAGATWVGHALNGFLGQPYKYRAMSLHSGSGATRRRIWQLS
ncbi:hypothetical protein BD289DRAFT_277290 [Coniella lustricola]|uniref:Uncharacterized protein n=1 Tax=Coniella lustricola TaxID=2025994 RepID=A0A2T3A6F6_9PEZI|nr:hypothetical protein BD289DRAFT_277290 [Coniella lustricola]